MVEVAPRSTSTGTDVAAALQELSALLLSQDSIEDVLQRAAVLAAEMVPDADDCGITLRRGGRVHTVATASSLAAVVDELQYEAGTGPCLNAMRTGETVHVPSMADEPRYGDYPTRALRCGVASSLSLPLRVDDDVVGAINFYSRRVDAFRTAQPLASLFADQAAIAATAMLRHLGQLELTAQLQTALASRAVIDQAIGVVMAQRRCAPDQAFAALRAVSQRRNVKLRVVAAELVETVSKPARKPEQSGPRP